MKHIHRIMTLASFVAILFGLNACQGSNESRGQQIGKKMDDFEKNVKQQVEKGKETAQNEKEKMKKKLYEEHEKAKETAHDVINKS